ncbi:ankyrin repeat domain-containing protein 34A-like [Sus scrofa]|uniref:ankyrin repeat domain-containing protein 34A-like n=1 Tax=Sus scrofa TaxID=9823 RepID=UPI000A2B3E2A|nr:ankyrin repeat domain-containing protein 34A-like [Sus scrofa]
MVSGEAAGRPRRRRRRKTDAPQSPSPGSDPRSRQTSTPQVRAQGRERGFPEEVRLEKQAKLKELGSPCVPRRGHSISEGPEMGILRLKKKNLTLGS